MSEIAQSYDVVVVGAGPTGCAAAAGYAQRGSRVLLLEANPKASKRFAGEWVHPYGAAVLERLGLMPHEASADHIPCYGFAVFPDDTTDPIRLEYTNGVGFSGEHADIVQGLRDRAAGLDPVTYLERARVTALTEDTVTFSHGRAEHTVHARLIVGADGRSSIVRKSLRADEELEADLVSHMAGLELHDVELPFEGYGHVLLGGPGPVLLYRIGERTIRACVDLPVDAPGARRDARFLWDGFASRFPAALRGAFKRALETQKLVWAANRFLPRTFYGRGSTALLGDAVGFYHPLTASGISVGVKDCEALLDAPSVAAYQRTREGQSYVPELLANALYQVFQREDDAAAAIRRAVFDTWRDHPEERDRTMRILGGEELRLGQFAGAFVRVAGRAVTDLAKEQGLGGAAQDLRHFLEFAQWPGASVMPAALRRRYRRDSDNLAPLRALGIRPRGPELPGAREFHDSIHVDVDALLAKVTDAPDLAGASPVQRAAADLEEVTAEGDLKRAVRLAQRLQEAPAADLADRHAAALALAAARRRFPGLLPGKLEAAQERFRAATLEEASDLGDPRSTALALETLHASGLPVFHPACRRAIRSLLAAQNEDGSFGGPRTTAIVCRALLRTEAPQFEHAERGLQSLDAAVGLPAEAGEALHLYRDRRATRVTPPRARRRGNGKVTASAEDRAYCEQALLAVSRSFARPIQMLPGDLGTAVMCGYLLCRIADTIEDDADFTVEERDLRYATFLEALEAQPEDAVVRRFEEQFTGGRFDAAEGPDATEHDLCRHLGVVLRVWRSLPEPMQRKASRWVAEMTRGMQLYSHRQAGSDGFTALYTVEDLERYCYFVAGTVGHMLTDLFVEGIGAADSPTEHALRANAEAFGLGLQLVNILKDVTDDAERGVSFVPRAAVARQGLGIPELGEPAVRDRAHAAVAPLFDRAQEHLGRALEYVLTVPSEHVAVRLFCLLPLWMAVRTLVHARGNDAMFVPGQPVKIARAEVEQLIADCMANAQSDEALRRRYDALWQAPSDAAPTPLTFH